MNPPGSEGEDGEIVPLGAPSVTLVETSGKANEVVVEAEIEGTVEVATDPRTPDIASLVRQSSSFEATGESGPMPRDVMCVTSKHEMKYGVVANVLSVQGRSGAKVTVDYNTGSNQSYGAAVLSASGAWSLGGTYSIEWSSGATRSWSSAAWVQNKINYRRYYTNCVQRSTWRPVSVNALFSGTKAKSPKNYPTCTTYSVGTYWKVTGKNFTTSGGVQFPTIHLSAQAGWNNQVRVAWTFSAKNRLCASSAAGWASSAWAGVRPPA